MKINIWPCGANGKQIWELQGPKQEMSDTKRNADTKENTDESICQVLLVRGKSRGCNTLSPPSTETEICQLDKFANIFSQVLILT